MKNQTSKMLLAVCALLIVFTHTKAQNYFAGTNAGLSNTTGTLNTGVGTSALRQNSTGSSNTAFGYESLRNNAIGAPSEAFGYQSQFSQITGGHNVSVGYGTLYSNVNSHRLTAVGTTALYYDTVPDNTAVGYQAAYYTVSGTPNEAFGVQALFKNTTGSKNSAYGYRSLYNSDNGIFNSAFGTETFYNLSGLDSSNTAMGYRAGYNYNNYSHCTFVGAVADANASSYSNSTAIGWAAQITGYDQARIGNTTMQSIGGWEDWTDLSDGRYKKDVKEDVPGLDFIKKLRPVTYHIDVATLQQKVYGERAKELNAEMADGLAQKSKTLYTGFIAQEVESAAKKSGYDFRGVDKPQTEDGIYGLRYAKFVVPLVKAVQEQQQMIEEQKVTLQKYQAELNSTVEKLNALYLQMQDVRNCCTGQSESGNINTIQYATPRLYNAVPNPTTTSTNITGFVPSSAKSAIIELKDVNGNIAQVVGLGNLGDFTVILNTATLAPGVYYYSLIVDGKVIDTKKLSVVQN